MLNGKEKRYCISKNHPLPKQVSNGTHAIDHELIIESLTVGAFLSLACVLLLGERIGKTTILTVYGRLAIMNLNQCVIPESGHMVEWLRHYATSCKVVGSIPHQTIRFFNPTMALRSTQPLTEMSAKNLPGGKEWPAHKADNLTYGPFV
jgi:hypothetical protein